MDLVGYLRLLRRRWWIILLAVVVCLGASLLQTHLAHKRFQSSTRLLVSGASNTGGADEVIRRQLAIQRATSFAQLASTGPVVSAVIASAEKSHPNDNIAAAAAAISSSASGDDAFLNVVVQADSAHAAQDIAAAFVTALPDQLVRLAQLGSPSDAQLTVVARAGLPASPYSPAVDRNALIGVLLGLALGVAAALIRETLDTTLRDSDEVRRLFDAPVLGIVPREFDNERLPAASRTHSRRSEAYRQIRTNLEFAADDRPPRSITITSPGQGEGKSATAANLALMYSRAGKSVVVVDADLRKPTMFSFFNATPSPGLSDVLSGRRTLGEVIQKIEGENLSVLASGPVVDNPSELIGSPEMQAVLKELGHSFDLIVVDTPPVLAVTDSLLAGVYTDGIVVLARMRSTTRSALRRSLESVHRVQGRLLGVVVNASVESEDKRYGYGYGYSSPTKTADEAGLHPVNPDSEPPVDAAPTPRGRHSQ